MKVVCPTCEESVDTRGFITHTMKKHNHSIEEARGIFTELKKQSQSPVQPPANIISQAPPIKLNEQGLPIANQFPVSSPPIIQTRERSVITMELGKK